MKPSPCKHFPLTISSEILNDAQTGLAVGDGGVEVVLLAVLIDAEALEVDVSAGSKGWFHGAWGDNRTSANRTSPDTGLGSTGLPGT